MTFRRLVLLGCIALLGCGSEPQQAHQRPQKKGVPIEDVPADLMAAAKKRLPDVKFVDAWKNVDSKSNKLVSYEIRGKNPNGKIREVRVGLDGSILEEE
jgi:hypothetical protein